MEYIKKKPVSSYSKHFDEAIKLISINPKNVIIYGSGAIASALWAGDVDLFEIVTYSGKKEEVAKKIASYLQDVVKNITKTPNVLLGDVKAGIYKPLYVDIGKIHNGKILNYYPKEIRSRIEEHYLSKEEFNKLKKKDCDYEGNYIEELLKLIKDKPTIKEFLELQEIIRQNYTLRWNDDEIKQGYKDYSRGGKKDKQYLWEAIQDKTPVKIDMLYPINGRVIEVTNFFKLYYKNNGQVKGINVEDQDDLESFILSLKDQILKLVGGKEKSYLKAVKRIATIARLTKDFKTLKLLTPILNSSLGLLYQNIGDMKALIDYIEYKKSVPFAFILNEIDLFRTRLSNIFEFQFHEEEIDKQIINIIEHKYQNNEKSKEFIVDHLKEIIEQLFHVLNKETKKALNKIGFIPIPKKYHV